MFAENTVASMRIKRQRRKLRGKYSGNCLSCTAKWSKCWYIASVDNQSEWEARLHTRVTPADDEVCFQCWDAKIRTSPKRKMHFKAEIPTFDAILADDIPYLRPSKRTDKNKRRALNPEGSMYSRPEAVYTPNLSKQRYSENDEDDEYNELVDENDMESFKHEDDELYKEGVAFEEESAVILLSTGFRTISPDHVYMNVDIDVHVDIDGADLDALSDDSVDSDDAKSKKRGAYYCGKCGKLKKGHVCAIPSPPLSSSAELFASSSPSPSPSSSLATQGALFAILQSAEFQLEDESGIVLPPIAMLAQPVVS